jgi:hypothetical protein
MVLQHKSVIFVLYFPFEAAEDIRKVFDFLPAHVTDICQYPLTVLDYVQLLERKETLFPQITL